MKSSLKQLYYKLSSLVIFKDIMNCRTMQSLNSLLKLVSSENAAADETIHAYADFVSNLYRHHNDLGTYILTLVFEDENICMIKRGQNTDPGEKINTCLENELAALEEISQISSEEIKKAIDYDGFLPDWDNTVYDFRAEYRTRIDNVDKYGYGIYAKYYMFIVKDGNIVPVKHPDEVKLSQLIGYETQRKMIIDNTLALLRGKPASNVLLTGDAGTGKSSSVKAIANEYRNEGLRIIEIRKDQLRDIPAVIDNLSANPLKFILFIDDLCFESDDDNFGALKAILEGSVSARTQNIAIYATSNRRHLVKENFSDRDGDDMHRNDTVQQLISLSERFGLKISFSKPLKDEYLKIVAGLAEQNGLSIPEEKLFAEAEQFALAKSGRSARAAKQFIDKMIAENT
ncbi:MAG: ATP-binding protein [Oscillospiraceae bacterium]|nr:ATP-binding protein [Oscillospiraceae bacterium]